MTYANATERSVLAELLVGGPCASGGPVTEDAAAVLWALATRALTGAPTRPPEADGWTTTAFRRAACVRTALLEPFEEWLAAAGGRGAAAGGGGGGITPEALWAAFAAAGRVPAALAAELASGRVSAGYLQLRLAEVAGTTPALALDRNSALVHERRAAGPGPGTGAAADDESRKRPPAPPGVVATLAAARLATDWLSSECLAALVRGPLATLLGDAAALAALAEDDDAALLVDPAALERAPRVQLPRQEGRPLRTGPAALAIAIMQVRARAHRVAPPRTRARARARAQAPLAAAATLEDAYTRSKGALFQCRCARARARAAAPPRPAP